MFNYNNNNNDNHSPNCIHEYVQYSGWIKFCSNCRKVTLYISGYKCKNCHCIICDECYRTNAKIEMMKALSQFKNGTYLKLRWQERGGWIGGTIDTIYETCNDSEEADYNDEYYACAFRVIDIFDNSRDIQFHKNELVEISKYNSPDLITRENGDIVYNRVSDSI